MAKELSRTFDLPHAAVIVKVQDNLGNLSSHTIYVTGTNGVSNVDAAVASILAATDTAAAAMSAAFTAAGWTPPSGN